jgi:hypothetical protein
MSYTRVLLSFLVGLLDISMFEEITLVEEIVLKKSLKYQGGNVCDLFWYIYIYEA